VQTFVNEATELVHVFADGEEIVCTNEHPFYSPVNGWTAACKLRAGDILVSLNGEQIIVEQVQHEILEAPIKVYNFEVEDFHTYFVGDGNGVLVHNTCGKPTSLNQMQKQIERGQAPDTVLRIDIARIPGTKTHIHFTDGTSINIDGSVHDQMNGIHVFTNAEIKWFKDNFWEVP